MKYRLFLSMAIASEVIATSSLEPSDVFSRPSLIIVPR